MMNGFIETVSGNAFYPMSPNGTDVNIRDIAHALAHICRFNGHTKHFYSVAQHSINCANLAAMLNGSAELQLACLMHDASEAYICDIPAPFKPNLVGYRTIETNIQQVIVDSLGIPDVPYGAVKEIDMLVLELEGRELMPCLQWSPGHGIIFDAYIKKLNFRNCKPESIRKQFMDTFKRLSTRVL